MNRQAYWYRPPGRKEILYLVCTGAPLSRFVRLSGRDRRYEAVPSTWDEFRSKTPPDVRFYVAAEFIDTPPKARHYYVLRPAPERKKK